MTSTSDAIPARRRGALVGRVMPKWSWWPTTVMVGPAGVLFTILVIVPMVLAVYYGFTDWSGYSSNADFVGLQNYVKIFTNWQARRAILVTAVLAVTCTIVINVAALCLAVLMNGPGKLNAFYRVVAFYPYVLSPIIVGFLWNAVLNPVGVANNTLEHLGLGSLPFLTDPEWAVGSLIIATIWNVLGFSVIIYLSGLQTIPHELMDAAQVDGASTLKRFWHVTLPLLRSTATVNIVLLLVFFLRTYELVLTLTGGGPAGMSETVAFQMLSVAYQNGELGYGSAESVLILIATMILALLILAYRRRREE